MSNANVSAQYFDTNGEIAQLQRIVEAHSVRINEITRLIAEDAQIKAQNPDMAMPESMVVDLEGERSFHELCITDIFADIEMILQEQD